MMGKGRVAPLKQITVPRMELTAAVLSVRVDKMLKSELHLELEDSVFWTSASATHTFVANCIAVIRQKTSVSQWRFVDTKSNPADEASRGLYAKKIVESKQWIQCFSRNSQMNGRLTPFISRSTWRMTKRSKEKLSHIKPMS